MKLPDVVRTLAGLVVKDVVALTWQFAIGRDLAGGAWCRRGLLWGPHGHRHYRCASDGAPVEYREPRRGFLADAAAAYRREIG